MRVMSSQRFLNDDIVEEKIEQLQQSGAKKLIIPVVNAFTKDLDGEDLYIMIDCHHRLAAAKEIGGIEIEYEEVEDEMTYYRDIEEQNGDAVCETWFMDSPWFYVETEDEVW